MWPRGLRPARLSVMWSQPSSERGPHEHSCFWSPDTRVHLPPRGGAPSCGPRPAGASHPSRAGGAQPAAWGEGSRSCEPHLPSQQPQTRPVPPDGPGTVDGPSGCQGAPSSWSCPHRLHWVVVAHTTGTATAPLWPLPSQAESFEPRPGARVGTEPRRPGGFPARGAMAGVQPALSATRQADVFTETELLELRGAWRRLGLKSP